MKDYKTPPSRLARLFNQGREQWRKRALERQAALRKLKVTVRDLKASRDQWKEEAKALSEKNARLTQTLEAERQALEQAEETHRATVGENSLVETHAEAPKGHRYPTAIIDMSIAQVMIALTGFRGAARSLAITAQALMFSVPSDSTIRLWCYRLGYYVLHRPIEYRDDWIFIIDMTVQ